MLLLHISDIHFKTPDCLSPAFDPERPYRTRLIQDVRTRVQSLGSVDAILITGDIAYKGDPDEYAVAYDWIIELTKASGCTLERVFIVPGNHDIDRGVILRTPAVRNAQNAILQSNPYRRENELRTQFFNIDTGRSLLEPLGAYNDFAKRFSCQVFTPDQLYWKQDLALEKGVTLRIHGLTSTILSGANGRDDTRESLYLSPLQTVLDPEDDVVNLVMCHHPPDWFMDQDDVQDAVNERAAVHLFGHKHRQRVTREIGYIRFSAGAVNPDRNDNGWQPGYNLVRLQVSNQGPARELVIEAHILGLQSSPERFRPIITREGTETWTHRISIPGLAPTISSTNPPKSDPIELPAAPVTAEIEAEVEAAVGNENTRNLVFRFWNLTLSERRDIALSLGLIDEAELTLPEPERYGRAFLRAGERELLSELAKEVEQKEKK